ncbi:hypothetical protein [Roseovarius aestuariivivens]|uniref:hypothetical protein n=1 Tax=Roseovarius aestuariivivens TaxID=1888910 RepID=UPI0010814838|nr:hypothetical protein [Roseovarius aestuariivivens]
MDDESQIRDLIGNHFEPMRWSADSEPDWDSFREDFLEGAVVCGAARPAQPRGLEPFIERMETVARQNLNSFEEHTRGMKILRFGNIAVVLAMSELLENGTDVCHDISGYLLVKSEGRWSILAHAWDQASDANPVPGDLQPPAA